jgi:gliding motility-associated-like protein
MQYMSAITSVDAIARYRWSIDADSVANTPALDYDYRIPGNHVLTFFIQTVNGCTFSITKNIIIDSILTNFSIDQNKFCDKGTVQFSNLSTAAYTVLYNWNFGDGDAYNGVDTTHTYLNPGDYTVKLWGTTQNGCTDSTVFTDTIHVYNLPVASIVGDSIHCSRGTHQYLANISSVDNIVRYQWFLDAVERSSDAGLTYAFNAGNHVVGLKVTTSNGCTDSVARNIIVDSVTALFSISQAKFCSDTGQVQFTDNTEHLFAITGYEWSFGDAAVASVQNPLHTYQPGVYDVQLAVVTEHGCADTLLKPAAIEVYRNPVAAFTGDSIHCTPGKYRYFSTSTANDPIVQYEWKVNAVNAGVTDTLDHNFIPAGLYAVQLTVTTDKGCVDDSIRQVVIDSVSAAFSIVNPRICGDTGTVRFNNLSGSRFGNRIYEWNFGDGQSSAETNPAHFYAAAGNYTVSLKASTAFGCSNTVLSTDTVIIYRTPTVAIAGADEKCMQHTLVYRPVIVTEDTVTAFTWRLNNTIISTADTMLYDFTTAGNYTVSLNVQTLYGCDVTVNKPVIIHPLPVPAAAPDTTICLGGTVLLRSYDGTSYQWEASPSLQNINTSTPLATPAATTDYFVTVINQFGCVQKDTVSVKVDVPVGLTVSASDSLCFGERRQLRATSTVNNYLWSPASTLTSATDDDPFATPDSTTTYQVIAFSNNVCKTDTGYVTIFVGYRPGVSAGADRNVANGTPIQLTAAITGNDISSILWTPSTGLDCTACADPKLVADDNITYTVTVATTFGCSNADNVRIVVFCGKGQLYIPNAFSPDGNGKNDVFYIKGYGIARIKRMMIFNRYGQKVFEKQNVPVNDPSQGWKGETGTQPPSGTAAYVYVLEVICKDGQEFSYKGTIMLVK